MAASRIIVPRTLSHATIFALIRDIEAAIADPASSAIVVAGGDDVFCEGLDFASLGAAPDEPAAPAPAEDQVRPALEAFAHGLDALRSAGKPSVALVAGAARGGGVGIAAAADVLIAAETSTFALPEILFGLSPAIVLPFLTERISLQTVRLWALTGEAQSAATAQAAGLVDRVVPEAELEAAGRRWLRRLGRGDAGAAATFKRHAATLAGDRRRALQEGVALTARALRDEAVLAAARRFADAGTPPWEAR